MFLDEPNTVAVFYLTMNFCLLILFPECQLALFITRTFRKTIKNLIIMMYILQTR